MGIFCSLDDSSAKFFKTFLMYGAAPTTIAAQTVTTVEAILQSYKLAPGWTGKILAPYTPADATDPGPGGSGYPNPPPTANSSKTAMDDGPGLGGGYNPGPGGSAGYPTPPPAANSSKTSMDDGPGLGGGYNPGPGLGGGYNPGPGGSAGYPTPPPTTNSSKTAMDDGPGLGGGYNPGPGLGGGYNPGPGSSAGYPNNGTDPSQSYSAVLWRNQQAIDHGFACVGANIVGNGSHSQTPVECGGWKPNF
jgi:hypothetical protein